MRSIASRAAVLCLILFFVVSPVHATDIPYPADSSERVSQAEPEASNSAQQTATAEMGGTTVTAGGEATNLEAIVVTATRIETPISEVTKSVSVVTARERDEQQQYFLPELIDNEPGVFLRRLGGPGQLSNISIRGAGGQHTQYQYNGFPLRDASDTQSTLQYFVEDLYAGSNLRQIEILKGNQSTLYGSQAMGGVINIIPEKWKRGTGGGVRSEFGERGTFIENGRFYHGQDEYFLDFNPIYVTTDGLKNGAPDNYYYENLGFTAGAGYWLTPDIGLEFSSIHFDSDLALSKITPALDASGNLVKNIADPSKHRESLLAQYGLAMNHSVSSCWNYSLKGAYTETQRHYFWSSVDGNQSNYDGSTGYFETQHNILITDWLTLLVGLDYDQSYFDGREPRDPTSGNFNPVPTKKDWYSWDMFGQTSFKLLDESLFLNLGGRFNNHEVFDSDVVGEASAAYLFKELGTKIHGQVGSGYRTPSLYEIHGGYLFRGNLITVGNPDLQPEESLGYEFGVEQTLLDKKLTAGLTWFHTDFDNLITYDSLDNRYMNATEARIQGVETYVNFTPWKWIRLDFAYTFADSEYINNNKWIRKEHIPQNKITGMLTFILPHNVTTSLIATWQDEKIVPLYDPDFNNVRFTEPAVITVDASISYKFLKHYETFLRIENLFDEDYTESGFIMPGRWVFGGVKLSF